MAEPMMIERPKFFLLTAKCPPGDAYAFYGQKFLQEMQSSLTDISVQVVLVEQRFAPPPFTALFKHGAAYPALLQILPSDSGKGQLGPEDVRIYGQAIRSCRYVHPETQQPIDGPQGVHYHIETTVEYLSEPERILAWLRA